MKYIFGGSGFEVIILYHHSKIVPYIRYRIVHRPGHGSAEIICKLAMSWLLREISLYLKFNNEDSLYFTGENLIHGDVFPF